MIPFVFVHGWGFDPRFWRAWLERSALRKSYCVDLGYFHAATDVPELCDDSYILLAHSAGLLWALQHLPKPRRIVAINSFAKFCKSDDFPNGVHAHNIKKMRDQIARDPQKLLYDFYKRIGGGYQLTSLPINVSRLEQDLQTLAVFDGRPALKRWLSPVLALAAEDDPLIRTAHAAAFMDVGVEIDLRIAPSGGHILPIAQLDWCLRQVSEVLP